MLITKVGSSEKHGSLLNAILVLCYASALNFYKATTGSPLMLFISLVSYTVLQQLCILPSTLKKLVFQRIYFVKVTFQEPP